MEKGPTIASQAELGPAVVFNPDTEVPGSVIDNLTQERSRPDPISKAHAISTAKLIGNGNHEIERRGYLTKLYESDGEAQEITRAVANLRKKSQENNYFATDQEIFWEAATDAAIAGANPELTPDEKKNLRDGFLDNVNKRGGEDQAVRQGARLRTLNVVKSLDTDLFYDPEAAQLIHNRLQQLTETDSNYDGALEFAYYMRLAGLKPAIPQRIVNTLSARLNDKSSPNSTAISRYLSVLGASDNRLREVLTEARSATETRQ